jgi:hypothetical protein
MFAFVFRLDITSPSSEYKTIKTRMFKELYHRHTDQYRFLFDCQKQSLHSKVRRSICKRGESFQLWRWHICCSCVWDLPIFLDNSNRQQWSCRNWTEGRQHCKRNSSYCFALCREHLRIKSGLLQSEERWPCPMEWLFLTVEQKTILVCMPWFVLQVKKYLKKQICWIFYKDDCRIDHDRYTV